MSCIIYDTWGTRGLRKSKCVLPNVTFLLIKSILMKLLLLTLLLTRYQEYLLNIDNNYFENDNNNNCFKQMINRLYPSKLLLNNTDSSDTKVPFCSASGPRVKLASFCKSVLNLNHHPPPPLPPPVIYSTDRSKAVVEAIC